MPTVESQRPGTRLILGLTLREHIGGRWAVSLLAFVLNAPLNIVSIVVNASETPGASDLGSWLIISVVGFLTFGGVLLVANFTVLRKRRITPVHVAVVVVVGAIAGGSRGFVVSVLAQLWQLPTSEGQEIAVRTLTGFGLGAVGVPLAALFLSVVSTYLRKRQLLVHEQTRLEVMRMQSEGMSERLRSDVLAHVEGDIQEVVDTGDPALARDLSRKIWEAPDDPPEPRLHIRQVLHTSITTNNYVVWPVAVVWALSAWGALSLAQGWISAVIQMTFTLSALWIIFRVARRLTLRHKNHALAIFVVANVGVVLVSGPLAWSIFDRREITDSLNLILVNAAWFPLIIFLVTVVSGAVKSSEEVLVRLQAQVKQEEVRSLAASAESERIRREIAEQLHGTVQTRLLTSAALMRQPDLIRQLGFDSPEQIFAELDMNPSQNKPARTLDQRVQEIVKPWSALMEVSVTVRAYSIPHSAQDALCRVLEEALSNAYRHGHASQVDCVIELSGTSSVMTVADNGVGPESTHTTGLGTALLELHTRGNWSLRSNPHGGSVLRAVIPGVNGEEPR